MTDAEAPPNPYQPSRAPERPARSDLFAFLAAVLLPLAVFLTAGAVLRVSALSPAGLLSLPLYDLAFTGHGLAGAFGPAAIPLATAALLRSPRPAGRLAWPALVALFVALVVALVTGSAPWFGVLVGLAHAVSGVALLLAARPGEAQPFRSWGLGGSGLALLLAGLSHLFGGPLVGSWMTRVLMASALVLGAESAARKPTAGMALSFHVCSLIVPALSKQTLSFMAPVQAISAVVLSVLVFRAARGAPPWGRRLVRLAAVASVQAALLRSFLSFLSEDMHLHDTLFPVGAAHLELLVPLVVLLSLLPGAPRGRFARLAPFALGLGVHVLGWAFLVLGARGMPRRYLAYLPQFQPLHAVATAGAIVALVMLGWMSLQLLHAGRVVSRGTD